MSLTSVPSSLSGSSARSTPVPGSLISPGPGPYKALSPSQSVTALSKESDDDLRRKGVDELVRITRRLESENRSLIAEHSSIIKDVNRRLQIYNLELRGLKDINQKLQDDNQELRDLCCFLDDDRQRGRKLAREWQRFGRYTASVMRSEVSAYQEKLKALEAKQDELITDNTELKELCLYLDQERLRFTQMRDEGDGSSNSTIAGNDEIPHPPHIPDVAVNSPEQQQRNDGGFTQQYIQQLENQIHMLEEEKRQLSQRIRGNGEDSQRASEQEKSTPRQNASPPKSLNLSTSEQRGTPVGNNGEGSGNPVSTSGTSGSIGPESPSKPEAVVHAMKVLEVHEQLERQKTDLGGENLDDKEKAIVREMCNVVWRKLGDTGSERSTPHPVYENIPRRQPSSVSPPHRPPPPPPPLPPPNTKSPPAASFSPPMQPPQLSQQNAAQAYLPAQPNATHSYFPSKPSPHSASPPSSYASSHHQSPPSSGPPFPHSGGIPHPGVSQTVHSQNVPHYQHFRSPPPHHPSEGMPPMSDYHGDRPPHQAYSNQYHERHPPSYPPKTPPPPPQHLMDHRPPSPHPAYHRGSNSPVKHVSHSDLRSGGREPFRYNRDSDPHRMYGSDRRETHGSSLRDLQNHSRESSASRESSRDSRSVRDSRNLQDYREFRDSRPGRENTRSQPNKSYH